MFQKMTRRASLGLALAAAVAGLSACGGGGGESVVADPEIPTSGRYVTAQHAETDITTTTVAYSTRDNWLGLQYTSSDNRLDEVGDDQLTLRLDVLTPPGASSSSRRPLVVWVHGGGFFEGSKSDTYDEAMSYARAGYVAATVDYRLTAGAGVAGPTRVQGVKDATEDLMNAIRFLKQHADAYGIDTSRIVTFGSSAGGALVLFNAIDPDTVSDWGLTSDAPSVSSRVAAAVSTGAVLGSEAYAQSTFSFSSSDSPVLLFHAKETDSETGYTWTDYVLPTQSLINASGNSCTAVAQPDQTHTVDLSLGGSDWTSNILPFLWARLNLSSL